MAVPLGEVARAAVAGLMEELRVFELGLGAGPGSAGAPGPGGSGRGLRWVRSDGLHITLRFLGPTEDVRLPALRAAVEVAAAGLGRFTASLDRGGTFPRPDAPRVLWIAVGEGAAGLSLLAARLGDALAAAGWPRDDRPVAPHLTLARADGVSAGARVGARLVARAADLRAAWSVDRVVLYESLTGGGPARYVPLHVVELAG